MKRFIAATLLLLALAFPRAHAGAISASPATGTTISAPACPDDDGSAGAATATIPYPTLVNGYNAAINQAHAPGLNCKVAGVNYGVGITTGTVLTDWQSGVSDCSVNTGTGIINCTGNNETINAIDFTLHGGTPVIVATSATGTLTITNSNFSCGQNYAVQIGLGATVNLVLKNNTFIGNAGCSTTSPSAFVLYNGPNGVIQYNIFKLAWQHVIEVGNYHTPSPGQVLDYRFNFLEDIAIGALQHENFLQFNGWYVSTATVEHNTSYMHTKYQPAEGYQFYDGSGGAMVFGTILFRYNTLIATLDGGQDTMGNMVHGLCHSTGDCASTLATVTSCNIDHNYADITGATALFYPSGGTAMWTACTLANNLNMSTGATITPQ